MPFLVHPRPPAVAEPAYRPFTVHVLGVERLTPAFSRVTFGGENLDELASNGYDQRVKIAFPVPSHGVRAYPRGADWFAAWRATPDETRNPLRTYTIRSERAAECEIDVDFVVHSAEGPAGAWLETAARGDEVVVVGPNRRHDGPTRGYEWRPPPGTERIVVGADETAVPAACAILEELPEEAVGAVLLEVPTADDVLDVAPPAGVDVLWLPRAARCGPAAATRSSSPRGALLCAALEDLVAAPAPGATGSDAIGSGDVDGVLWDVPEDDEHGGALNPGSLNPSPLNAGSRAPYVWLAGEAGVVGGMRRRLLQDVGLARRSLAAMGYWREGRAAAS